MHKYTFDINFTISVNADNYKEAIRYLNKKYFSEPTEMCSFVNVPVDEIVVYPNAETVDYMTIIGEDGHEVI